MHAITITAMLAACTFRTNVTPADGDIVTGDERMIDAPPPDIDPTVCSTAGLLCATPVVMIACSGGCWVGCRESTTHAVAKQRCAGWSGKLGRVESAAEEMCVNTSFTGTARWTGLEQMAGSLTRTENWSWAGDGAMLPYTNWAGGQPNDADGTENDEEQCAYMSNPSGLWHDTPCAEPTGAFMCRR